VVVDDGVAEEWAEGSHRGSFGGKGVGCSTQSARGASCNRTKHPEEREREEKREREKGEGRKKRRKKEKEKEKEKKREVK